ncbi:hypothetical protein F5050DRAFT_1852624, partial [Lentinula boryana]
MALLYDAEPLFENPDRERRTHTAARIPVIAKMSWQTRLKWNHKTAERNSDRRIRQMDGRDDISEVESYLTIQDEGLEQLCEVLSILNNFRPFIPAIMLKWIENKIASKKTDQGPNDSTITKTLPDIILAKRNIFSKQTATFPDDLIQLAYHKFQDAGPTKDEDLDYISWREAADNHLEFEIKLYGGEEAARPVFLAQHYAYFDRKDASTSFPFWLEHEIRLRKEHYDKNMDFDELEYNNARMLAEGNRRRAEEKKKDWETYESAKNRQTQFKQPRFQPILYPSRLLRHYKDL